MESRGDPNLKLGLLENHDTAYALVVVEGAVERTHRTGLSHPTAMTLAEELQRDGKIVRVMHNMSGGSYEVDRYPLR